MRVLTVGESPYLLTKLGKMNSSLLIKLKEDGHEISSAVWNLDISWFISDEEGNYQYDVGSETICSLFPFINNTEQSSTQLYEIMKRFRPDVVISIGGYKDSICVAPIKSLHPNLFSWIGIFAIDALPINENKTDIFNNVDFAICTTRRGKDEICKIIGENSCCYLPFGPDKEIFFEDRKTTKDTLNVICCSKNSQSSNIPCFLQAVAEASKIEPKISGYLHTNLYDVGDYDLHLLIDRFKAENNIKLPNRFVGLNDGFSNEEMRDLYNQADIVVDVSVKSSTGLSVLEGMATGCIPVCTNTLSIGEILNLIKDNKINIIPSYNFIGEDEENFVVGSVEGLRDILLELYRVKNKDLSFFERKKKESIEIVKGFSKSFFVEKVVKMIKDETIKQSKVTIESL